MGHGTSGLITPGGVALISTRERDVYTDDERRLLDRCAKMLTSHGDKIQIRCGATSCPDPVVKITESATESGGAVMRCGCTDRVLSWDTLKPVVSRVARIASGYKGRR